MDFSFTAGTKASNGRKAASNGAAAGSNAESARFDSGFAGPLFSPGAGSALHRKAGNQRRKAARPASGGQPAAPAQPAVPAARSVVADSVFGSTIFGGAAPQGKSGRPEPVGHAAKGPSPQKGRRVRPAWVSGVQPDASDAGISQQPAAPGPSRPEPRTSFVFGGFTAGQAGDQNASPYRQHGQPLTGKCAPQAVAAGVSKDDGALGSPAAQPAARRSSGGPLPSPGPLSPQVPLTGRVAAAAKPAPGSSPDTSEPPLWKEFAGFSLGKAPSSVSQKTPQAVRTLADAFQQASLRDSDAASLADRFADSLRVRNGAPTAGQTPTAATAAAQPAGACPTPPPPPHAAGLIFGGALLYSAYCPRFAPAAC